MNKVVLMVVAVLALVWNAAQAKPVKDALNDWAAAKVKWEKSDKGPAAKAEKAIAYKGIVDATFEEDDKVAGIERAAYYLSMENPSDKTAAKNYLDAMEGVELAGAYLWSYYVVARAAGELDVAADTLPKIEQYCTQSGDAWVAMRIRFITADKQSLAMATLLGGPKIEKWTADHEALYRLIDLRDEAAWRTFCSNLFDRIQPYDENLQIKTLLNREKEGQ